MESYIPYLNSITDNIIGCAIEVHRNLGPGLLESIYENALCIELNNKDIEYKRQVKKEILYKGVRLGYHRIDLIIEDAIIIEIKAVDRVDKVFHAQLLSYLKITGKKVGLLINFNESTLQRGIKRMIL